MTANERAFLLRRAYGWGILIVSDASTTAWPEPAARVVGNEAGVVIPVRHAQDVEVSDDLPFDAVIPLAEVEVECFTNCVAEEVVAYDGYLALSDGRVCWVTPRAPSSCGLARGVGGFRSHSTHRSSATASESG